MNDLDVDYEPVPEPDPYTLKLQRQRSWRCLRGEHDRCSRRMDLVKDDRACCCPCHACRFGVVDQERAYAEWGSNCGPGAIAAIAGLTLDELRPHLGDFEQKRYTNPTLMWAVLRRLGLQWSLSRGGPTWPVYGLARVQWEGPWTRPGVPMAARYRRTHWVGSRFGDEGQQVFDINCICVGGWVSLEEWSGMVVPWLLREFGPKADGAWHLTHVVEVSIGKAGRRV